MRLLLGSGGISTPERLALWKSEFAGFLGDVNRVLFVPYALRDHDGYVEKMVARGFGAGREIQGIHTFSDPKQAVRDAEAIFVGGGNSWRLLDELYRLGLVDVIRERVRAGLPYIGVSAGTNMACPTLMTTNDMPIVQPPSFAALGLVPFQINPHYFAGAIHYRSGPPSEHGADQPLIPYGGETRDDRIREFHEMNERPVVGLYEGAVLRVKDSSYELSPGSHARLFLRGQAPQDLPAGSRLPIE